MESLMHLEELFFSTVPCSMQFHVFPRLFTVVNDSTRCHVGEVSGEDGLAKRAADGLLASVTTIR